MPVQPANEQATPPSPLPVTQIKKLGEFKEGLLPFGMSTLKTMDALFIKTHLVENSEITIPTDKTGQQFKDLIDVYKEWLALYIRDTLTDLSPITDIRIDIDIIDNLKSLLKPNEQKDLDPGVNEMKALFQQIEDIRQKRKEENQALNEAQHKAANDLLKMPSVAKTSAGTEVLSRQTKKLDVFKVEIKRLRDKENEARSKADQLLRSLEKRVGTDKLNEAYNKTKTTTPTITPELK